MWCLSFANHVLIQIGLYGILGVPVLPLRSHEFGVSKKILLPCLATVPGSSVLSSLPKDPPS